MRLSWHEIAYWIGKKDGESSDLFEASIIRGLEQVVGELQQRINNLEKNQ